MSDPKISELVETTSIDGTELVPVLELIDGIWTTRKSTVTHLLAPEAALRVAGVAAAAADATTKANAAQAAAVLRSNHTGTQSADTLTDGSTNKAFLATERTKLAGIATGAGQVNVRNPPQVGIHSSGAFYDSPQHATDVAALLPGGFGWLRFQVSWSDLESSQGAITGWALDRLDDIVNTAIAQNLNLVGIIFGAPGWSNGSLSLTHAPTSPESIRFICDYLANRYRGKVQAWEVWNEPNLNNFWSTPNATNYTALLKVAYEALKGADPNCTVLGGVVANIDTAFVTTMYAAGAARFMDGLSLHYYPQTNTDSPLLADTLGTDKTKLPHLTVMRNLMMTNGNAALPIWMTEFGWYTTGDAPTNVTAAVQASYITTVLTELRDRYPYVTHAFYYKDWDGGGGGLDDGYSLLNADYSAKAGLAAFATFVAANPPPAPVVRPAWPASRVLAESHVSAGVASSTAEQTLSSLVIRGNSVAIGDLIRFTAVGKFTNSSGSGVTYLWKFKLGSTTLFTTATDSWGSQAYDHFWKVEATIQVATLASEVIDALLMVTNESATWATINSGVKIGYEGVATATEDLTADKAVILTCQMGTSNASASVACLGSSLQLLK